MTKKIIFLSFFIFSTLVLWYFVGLYDNIAVLRKLFYSFVIIDFIYGFFALFLRHIVARKITSYKSKYSFRKIIDILFWILTIIFITNIWVEDPQTLLISYGLVAAGVAVALQDVFKNLAGGLIIVLNGLYKVGDRIEIKNKSGDVIDIGVLYTFLFETKEWIKGDQSTGRISIIPNGYVLSNKVNNHTKDHNFIWDEITIDLSYNTDINVAVKEILKIAKRQTKKYSDKALKQFKRMKERYYMKPKDLSPNVYVNIEHGFINLNIRYITTSNDRREIANLLKIKVFNFIKQSENVTLAGLQTFINITEAPKLEIDEK
jgi:small-conductance mechanosensitive channel